MIPGFTDHELDQLTNSAAAVAWERRDAFLRAIVNELPGSNDAPVPGSLPRAIAAAQRAYLSDEDRAKAGAGEYR